VTFQERGIGFNSIEQFRPTSTNEISIQLTKQIKQLKTIRSISVQFTV